MSHQLILEKLSISKRTQQESMMANSHLSMARVAKGKDRKKNSTFLMLLKKKHDVTISVSGQLPTYPSPNPVLTLTWCQLTVVELGEG